MIKITYIFSFLAILLLGFSSCSSDNALINHPVNQSYRVLFTLNNAVTSTRNADVDEPSFPKDFTTAALNREKMISSLYAIVFNKVDDTFIRLLK